MQSIQIVLRCLSVIFSISLASAQKIPFKTQEDEAEFKKIQEFLAQREKYEYVVEELLLDVMRMPLKIIYVGATRHGVIDNFIPLERPKSLDVSEILKELGKSKLISRVEADGLTLFVLSKSANEMLAYAPLALKIEELKILDGNMFLTLIQISKSYKIPLFITPDTIALMERTQVYARSYSNLTIIDVYREVDPENWTGGIVKPKPEKRSKTCPRKTDGNSAQNSKPRLGWKHLKA